MTQPARSPTRTPLLVLAVALLAAPGSRAATVPPYEADAWSIPRTRIDQLLERSLKRHGLEMARPCSDAVFLRRVYLDLLGKVPDAEDARAFLADRRPGKRAELIDSLLEREEFAGYWSLKWCDLLRVKAEFSVNLWPNAVQAYHRWVEDALRQNRPCDEMARELLTSSGSNFRVPAVNFYRAVQGRDPQAIAAAVALTFMGTRTEEWPEARREGMAAFFSRVAYKRTAEWKEEIVLLDPAPAGPLAAVFPDGDPCRIPPGQDPRQVFADWLLAPDNEWFARSMANRVWSWLLGRGIIHEPDDIRPDNRPVHPQLLAYLEKELVDSGYDLRHLYRLILTSRAYQQSCIPRSDRPEAPDLFACYPVRRLEAEVLIDALTWIGGKGESYSSAIPEPYTFIPDDQPTVELADGSISSPLLELFGRPARDTGLEEERNNLPSAEQRLYLLNSTDVRQAILRGPVLRRVIRSAGGDRGGFLRRLYLTLLSRMPVAEEVAAAEAYLATDGITPQQAAEDLAWALINSKEFLFRH